MPRKNHQEFENSIKNLGVESTENGLIKTKTILNSTIPNDTIQYQTIPVGTIQYQTVPNGTVPQLKNRKSTNFRFTPELNERLSRFENDFLQQTGQELNIQKKLEEGLDFVLTKNGY